MITVSAILLSLFIGIGIYLIGHWIGYKQGWDDGQEWIEDQIVDIPTDDDLVKFRKFIQYKQNRERENK